MTKRFATLLIIAGSVPLLFWGQNVIYQQSHFSAGVRVTFADLVTELNASHDKEKSYAVLDSLWRGVKVVKVNSKTYNLEDRERWFKATIGFRKGVGRVYFVDAKYRGFPGSSLVLKIDETGPNGAFRVRRIE